MVEPIESAERVVAPTMALGAPPKHTENGHERCAYYPNLSLNTMSCPHGEYSTGAFYSEDYVREMRLTLEAVVGLMNENRTKWIGERGDRQLVEKMRDLVR